MLIKNLIYSASIIIAQWLIIKTLLTSGGLKLTGDYFYYLSVIAPVFMLLGANFKNYATQESYGRWRHLFKYRISNLFLIGSIFILYFLFSFSEVLLLVFLFKCIEYMLDTILAAGIRFNSLKYAVFQSLLLLVTITIFYVLVALLNLDFITSIYLTSFLVLLNIIICFFRGRSFCNNEEGNTESYTYNKIFTLIGVPAFLISVTASIPRLAIEIFSGVEDVAVFGSFIYFYLIAQVITLSVFQSKIRFLKLNRNKELYNLILIIALVGMLGLLISVFFGEFIISFVFSEDLLSKIYYLPYFIGFIIVGACVQVLEQYYILTSKNKLLFKINFFMLLYSLILCPILVFNFGLVGSVIYMYVFHFSKIFILLKLINKIVI